MKVTTQDRRISAQITEDNWENFRFLVLTSKRSKSSIINEALEIGLGRMNLAGARIKSNGTRKGK